jgi:hypothetical protein
MRNVSVTGEHQFQANLSGWKPRPPSDEIGTSGTRALPGDICYDEFSLWELTVKLS